MVKFNEKSLGTRVLIKPFIEKVSKGGIVISRDARTQAINTNQGEVYMIGNMAWYDLPQKPDFKVGDKVYYAKYGAMTLQVDGVEDFLVLCSDVDLLVGYEHDDQDVETIDE